IADYLKTAPKQSPFHRFAGGMNLFVKLLKLFQKVFNLLSRNDFVDLLRWNGKGIGNFHKWKVLLPNGRPLKIEQTLHQIGLTKDYIVLADTSFKFDADEILPQSNKQIAEDIEILGLDLLDYQQLPNTNLYLVRRADLNPNKTSVKVRPVQIPLAMAHFLVDYDNPDDKITLHAAHICATDPSEYIRIIDRDINNDPMATCDLQKMAGAISGPMDVSRLGCYVIDAKTGEITLAKITHNLDYTWATAFYACRDYMPTKQFEDIYWSSWGAWPNIISNRIFNLYKDYEDRQVPSTEVLDLANKGIPSSLCHLHIKRKETTEVVDIELKDNYKLPPGCLASSAQFIPRAGKTGSTEGYIVCVVIQSHNYLSQKEPKSHIEQWSDNSEIWIFDA
ncbi:MAG TPA: carotenoid oxygenase family protein, partial [Phormidium sp.]